MKDAWIVTLRFPVYNIKKKEDVKLMLPILLSSHEVCHEQIIPNAKVEPMGDNTFPIPTFQFPMEAPTFKELRRGDVILISIDNLPSEERVVKNYNKKTGVVTFYKKKL